MLSDTVLIKHPPPTTPRIPPPPPFFHHISFHQHPAVCVCLREASGPDMKGHSTLCREQMKEWE